MPSCHSSLPWHRGSAPPPWLQRKHLAWPRGAHQAHCTPTGAGLQHPESGRLQEKDNSKAYMPWGHGFCLCSGISFPSPAITSRAPCFVLFFFCTQVCGDSSRAGAMSRTRDGKTEMSVQSRVRLLNGSRRLAEVSVFPSVPCLRWSVSAPEIPCLRRRAPCPQAMATASTASAWGIRTRNTGGLQLVFSTGWTTVGASQ